MFGFLLGSVYSLYTDITVIEVHHLLLILLLIQKHKLSEQATNSWTTVLR